MKKLTWDKITVQQYIDVDKLSDDKKIDSEEKVEKIIAILFNLTERDVEELPITTFNNYAKQIGELLIDKKIPGKAVRYIKVNGRKYAIEYNPTKLMHRQYVELQFFQQGGVIQNLHLLMASIIRPVRFGFKMKNDAKKHSVYAEDILNARFIDVYHTCVFFCNLFRNLIQHTKVSLAVKMMKMGATMEQSLKLLNASLDAMDGFIPLEKLQPLKV